MKFAANKGELARLSLREVTDNWQPPLDPEAASLERWWRLEVGRRGRSRSSSWETELNLEFLGNWKIPLDPKKLKTSKHTVRGSWGGGRVSSFQVPRSVADIYPIISATLSRAASCCFCSSLASESMKTLVVWRKDALGVLRVGGKGLNKCGKSHLFLYLHHSAHK